MRNIRTFINISCVAFALWTPTEQENLAQYAATFVDEQLLLAAMSGNGSLNQARRC